MKNKMDDFLGYNYAATTKRFYALGKMLFKLKIIDAETGCQPTDVALLKRLVSCYMGMSILSELMTVSGICYVSLGMAMGRKDGTNQSLWDKVANTVVIDESGR